MNKREKSQSSVEYLLLMSMVVSAIWIFCRSEGPGAKLINDIPNIVLGDFPYPPSSVTSSIGPIAIGPGVGAGPIGVPPDIRTVGPSIVTVGPDIDIAIDVAINRVAITIPMGFILGEKDKQDELGAPELSLPKGSPKRFVVEPSHDSESSSSDLVFVKEPNQPKPTTHTAEKSFVFEP